MNIFMHELRAYRKATLLWTLSLMGIVVLFLSFYPSIASDMDDFTALLEGFPEPVREAFGIQLESLGTITGFYAYVFLYISLCGAIQGMTIGVSILSKEVREKTADFLLTKPVSRTKVLTAKLAAAFISLLLTNVAFIATVMATASVIQTEAYSSEVMVLISLTLLFTQLIFLALGILIAVVFPRIKSVLTVSLGIVFGFFFISMIASIGEGGAKRYLSPFQYFDRQYIMQHSSYETSFLLTAIGIVIVSLVASFVLYRRKDIHTV
ncbi:ABC transporter permease subunit [Halobacillus sp. BBL2006]|uniref:ABC transporter permease subunit n=1 Tax=Halobacillus sp. BBL2006 TaxID=1543706 RepID=UPI0005427D90|nr:ABC transporter permease subunit [Halobacillus sp. BBL2006]KHE67112.1 ABC transporter permease [Halobacillus sp. BBL2006]